MSARRSDPCAAGALRPTGPGARVAGAWLLSAAIGGSAAWAAPPSAPASPAAAPPRPPVVAEDTAARELMRAVQEMAAAPHEIIELTMTLIDAGGQTHQRETTIYQQQRDSGRMARVTRFHTPPEMAGAGVLAIENVGRDDDWWIYLPAYHTTRRISSGNRGDTYMGTDFSYEDLTDLRLDEYDFALGGWIEIEGVRCRELEARPRAEDVVRHSLYSRRVYYVDPARAICPRAIFYGRDGRPLKEIHYARAVSAGGRWRWDRTEMRNVRTGHATILDVRERRWQDPIPDRIFSERALRRPG